jgi:hypothetical protein
MAIVAILFEDRLDGGMKFRRAAGIARAELRPGRKPAQQGPCEPSMNAEFHGYVIHFWRTRLKHISRVHILSDGRSQPPYRYSNWTNCWVGVHCNWKEQLIMDAFWLIPVGMIGGAIMALLYLAIRNRPIAPSTPNVVLDKPADQPAVDPAEKARDWQGRPCGSYLDALNGRKS